MVVEGQQTVVSDMTVETGQDSVVTAESVTEQPTVGAYKVVHEDDDPVGKHVTEVINAVLEEQSEEDVEDVEDSELDGVDVVSLVVGVLVGSLFEPPPPPPSEPPDPLGGQLPMEIPKINLRQNDGNFKSNGSGRLGQ